MKYYKEFIVTTEPFLTDLVSGALWELEITGVNEEVNCLKVFADAGSTLNAADLSSELQKLVGQKLLRSYNVEENLLEDKNWNEEWEKNMNVIVVSDKIVVKPTFRDYEAKPGQIVITIDPKMSFGTGEHQTTKLILLLLEKYAGKGTKVLDVGSGTAVLAIASVKFGAVSAIAVDNDERCSENGRENCELNNTGEKVDVRLGTISDIAEKEFDLILVNIQKNVILGIADEIKARAKKDTVILLSGLLLNDEEDIKAKYTGIGFVYVEKKEMGEWIAMVFRY